MNDLLQYSKLRDSSYNCPNCESEINDLQIVFEGIHIGMVGTCDSCDHQYFFDLPIGHSIYARLTVNLTTMEIDGEESYLSWYGQRLLDALQQPKEDPVTIDVTINTPRDQSATPPIVVNCIDPTFTHVLFKSTNVKILREKHPDTRIIILIPPNIRWMVPEYVDEIWQIEKRLSELSHYFLAYNKEILKLLEEFDDYYLSHTVPEPKIRELTDLTGVPPHDFDADEFRFTYVWRQDRIWAWDSHHVYKFAKFPFFNPMLWIQKRRIVKLFKQIRKTYPNAKCTVTGFGTDFSFPSWIEDLRFADYTDENHKRLCEIYSESRLVYGIHGADMVLPSAHAGIMFNMIPIYKWSNYAEDIILRNDDPYFSIYRFQFLPASISPKKLADISLVMLHNRERYIEHKISIPDMYS